MKIGELLKIKNSGINSETEYGIYLDREKGGKEYLYTLFTLKGKVKLKRSLLKSLRKPVRFNGSTGDTHGMTRFLIGFKKQLKKKGANSEDRVKMTSQAILRGVKIKDLWQSVISFMKKQGKDPDSGVPVLAENGNYLFNDPIDVKTIAKIHFHPKILSGNQIKSVGKILKTCSVPGKPFFSPASRRSRFFVYTAEAMSRVEKHVSDLESLKSRYVVWKKQLVDESGKDRKKLTGRKVPTPRFNDPMTVKINGKERKLFAQLFQWSKDFFRFGGWGNIPKFGLGKTPVTRLGKFSLPRYIEFFGMDISGEKKLDTLSSLLEFLLRFDKITWKEASEFVLGYRLKTTMSSFGYSFPSGVLEETKRLKTEKSRTERRKDLRELEYYTIDPEDAKDFDDAVGFRQFTSESGEKRCELYVHIADVTNYVSRDTTIDDFARRRATSVYLPTGVIPMLPTALSEDICSLRAGVDRLAFSTRLLFNGDTGELISRKHHRSVIRVNKNLSYDFVNKEIAGDKDSVFSKMFEFSQILEEKEKRLGIVTKERKVRFTRNGNGLELNLKSPSPATKMIEQFMVVTNEAVAETIRESEKTSVYRIHPLPDRVDIENWNTMCSTLGHEEAILDIDFDSLERSKKTKDKDAKTGKNSSGSGKGDLFSQLQAGGKLTLGGLGKFDEQEKKDKNNNGASGVNQEETDGKEKTETQTLAPMNSEDLKIVGKAYGKALSAVEKMEEEKKGLLYSRILSTMPRAVYSKNNHGHFGLNSLCYTHFTSPIRRYPDIIVHRVLASIISENPDKIETEKNGEDISDIIEICNEQSRAAESLERDMIDVALATRASRDRDYRGETHKCIITGLTPTSCFLNLDGATEGRIPLSRLSNFRLTVDESESVIMLGKWENKDENPEKLANFIIEKTGEKPGWTDEKTPLPEEGSVVLYRLGQRLKCRVRGVKLGEGKVDLSIVK